MKEMQAAITRAGMIKDSLENSTDSLFIERRDSYSNDIVVDKCEDK